jgi:hypothetical protein
MEYQQGYHSHMETQVTEAIFHFVNIQFPTVCKLFTINTIPLQLWSNEVFEHVEHLVYLLCRFNY